MNPSLNADIAWTAVGAEWICREVPACSSASVWWKERGSELWHRSLNGSGTVRSNPSSRAIRSSSGCCP